MSNIRPIWIDSSDLPTDGTPLQLESGATGKCVAGTPGGGAAISTPQVAYLQTDGGNGTAVIGDPSKPFATAQAAGGTIPEGRLLLSSYETADGFTDVSTSVIVTAMEMTLP